MRCPACGASHPDESRFCPSCGARIAGHGEERRVVTVLFADMVGFTSLSERRDPEQVKHLVDRCFQWLTAEIVSFGGRVDKIVGDAILALFGAPVAHEDDAERAVRAALRMQEIIDERADELGGAVRLRIGVNTGEVLVGALSAGGDYTAMGDVVNSANRLQVAAGPGEVLVGESTHTATDRVIPYDDRGPVRAKGRDEPLHAWLARTPRTAPGERPDRTKGPMVGRDGEVGVLGAVASTALANDRASLLVLLGDAGMGKSRVAAEVTASLERTGDVLLLQGRCLPYGEVNVWWPLAEALRGVIGVAVGDPLEVVEPALRALVARTMHAAPDDREVDRTVAGLVQLFGFAESREGVDIDRSREETVRCFVTLLDALADDVPVVLVLADLHWADQIVLDVVRTALHALARRPVVVVTTARRSVLQRWTVPVGRFDTFSLNLEALDASAVDALIDRLVGDGRRHALSDSVRATLRERSGGNPLFLIELLALMEEQDDRAESAGGGGSALPDTLRGLVSARLDNLDAAQRAVIDDASVLGRRGRVEHLSEMGRQLRGSGDVAGELDALVERDLLRVEGGTWEFTSDVTREVAYGMLTKSDRAKKHLGVAQWVEAAYAEAWDDRIADLLAHHYGQSVALLDDLGTLDHLPGDLRERALHWIDVVSARGERMRLLPAVERLCTQGLALAGDVPGAIGLQLVLRRARARVQMRDGAGAISDAAAAREVAALLGDDTAEAAVLLVEGEVAQQRGDLAGATATFADAVERYSSLGDVDGRAEALRSLGMTQLFAGTTAEAERTTSEALEAFRSIGRRSGEAWALQNLAWISFVRGRTAEAEKRIDESLALFDTLGMSNGASWARGMQGFVLLAKGDLVGAEEVQRRVLAEAQAGGERWASSMMLLLGAVVQLWTGRTEGAVGAATEGLEGFRAVHDRFGMTRVVWPLARGLAMRGEVDAARRVLDDVRRDVTGPVVGVPAARVDGVPGDGASVGDDASVAEVGPGRQAIEDRVILAVSAASVEAHLGQPGTALAIMAGLADELGLGDVAAGLRGDGGGDVASWIASATKIGAGSDPVTVVATALAQAGRVPEAAEVFDATAREEVGGVGDGPAFQATLALVRAAQGRNGDVARAVSIVKANDRASYLDRTLAEIAAALTAARTGDSAAADAALDQAADDVGRTGDQLTKGLVRLAAAYVHDDADARESAVQHLAERGTDAHGWSNLFGAALGVDDVPTPA